MPEWHKNLNADPGWGAAAFDGAEEMTPKRIKILKTKLVEKNLICMSGGNVFIFLTSINCWSIMCSDQAISHCNSLMEADSATVNFNKAFGPFVEFMERHAVDNVATVLPQSICIGTTRLRVVCRPTGLSLKPCESLLPVFPDKGFDIPARLCYGSIASRRWPSEWEKTERYPMYRFLKPLFVDPIDMSTIEWCIGNALVDPHSSSKAVVLYGQGGRGKGTFLGALTIALIGCCGTIPDGALVSVSRGMPVSIASTIVSNRIVTAGDVGSMDDTTNLSIIKTITGHDFIPIPPTRARSACTLFYASNRLDDPTINTEWPTEAIMRRAVVINFTAYIPEGIEDVTPQDPVSRLDFALRCVHTRLSNPYMPVSPFTVITTILGSKIDDAMKFLAPIDPEEADEDEVILANNIIAGYAGVTTAVVGQLATRISHNAVCEIRSKKYIKGIVPSNAYVF